MSFASVRALCMLTTTMTSVTTALPTLGQVFGRADISPWVGTAYLLTSTVKPLSYFCSSETEPKCF